MAVDKLIDSSKLDACCTAEANAIRAKTGGSSSIAYDWANSKGFADAIAAISGGGGSGYYNLTSDSIYQLFDQYATENGMTKMDLTFASDQTDYFTVQHTLGKVPTEALLYPKNVVLNGGDYQAGWTINSDLFGKDKAGNRTYMFRVSYPPTPNVVWYPDNKNIITFLSSIFMTDYNFTRSVPTSTEIELRGGSNSNAKLKAGEYVLALK